MLAKVGISASKRCKMRIFYMLLFWSFLAYPAMAKTDYAITVPIETEAEDSVAAKEKAMADAQRQAFLTAAAKLTTAENVQKLNEFADDTIVRFVQSISVDNEKAGGNKYVADLTVQINENLLRDYLLENEMIDAKTKDLLVIPVFKSYNESRPVLWENSNFWRRSWRDKGRIKFGTLQMVTIGEHFRSINELDADTAMYMPSDIYQKVSELNGSDHIYVIVAEVIENGDLKVIIKNLRNQSEDSFAVYNDHNQDVYDKAIEKSVMFIANMERNDVNEATKAAVNTINAVYVYQNMRDWLLKSKNMEALESVEGIDVKSIGAGKVSFSVQYTGSIDKLWSEMQEAGFSHVQEDNYFIIR